jgi:peptidoglycan glycosyltransferase
VLARRHLLRERGASVIVPCLVTAGLIVTGFALAHIGMHLSWTGTAAITNLDWLHYSALCIAALCSSQALLHLVSGRSADRLLIPVAAFLASLGAINLYVWETRDANAYVSTVALPALRDFEDSTARDMALSRAQKMQILRALGPVPNELEYERLGLGTATVLDRGWVETFNASARRASSLARAGRSGSVPVPAVHPVDISSRLDKQVFALMAGLLLVPLTLLAASRRLLRAAAARTTIVFAGTAAVLLGTAATAAFASPDRNLPLLIGVGGHSLTAFELLKLALVLVLALSFAYVSAARDPARRVRIGLGLVVATAAIYVALSRDFGAGVALLAVTGLMASLLVRRPSGIAPVAIGVAVLACAPPVVGALASHLPETVSVRIEMWSEPWGSYHRIELQKDISRTLARIVETRAGAPRTVVPSARSGATQLDEDVAKIAAELRFRADAVAGRPSSARPLVPALGSHDERLLFEAERLWTRLRVAGSAPRSPEAKASLHARVERAIHELQQRADAPASTAGGDGRQQHFQQDDQLGRDGAADDFQIQRALFALRQGGVLGTGLGRGRPEAVPGLSEDLPLVAVGEMLGFAGLLVVALFVLLLAGRALELACRQGRSLAGFLAAGLGMLFGLQALIGIGALAVALPFTGLTFPFLSRSGTALAGNFVGLGLLAAVAAASQRPRAERARGRSKPLAPAGFSAAFALVLMTVAAIQITGRTATGGPFLAGLPGGDAPFIHAGDQWALPSYRSVAGPITDRSGRVVARTRSMAGERLYPNPGLAATLAHTLVRLEADFRDDLQPETPSSSPSVGPALVTTIDAEIQQAVDRAITAGVREAGLEATGSVRGAALVVDSRTGAIRAVASRPTFSLVELHDPTSWGRAEARDRRHGFAARYLNRAVAAEYPPASTFKTITAAATLDLGLHALRSQDFNYTAGPQGPRDPDGLEHRVRWHRVELPYGPPITDTNHPHVDDWRFNLIEAFAWSCNVAFGELGMELGPANLIGFARRFGFEREIIVPGLGTSMSIVDDGWNERPFERRLARTLAGQARTAFGQEHVRATPLQMALVAAAIANGGTIMTPHVVAGLRSGDGKWIQRHRPRALLRTGLSTRTLAGMRTMMRAAVTYGLGRRAKLNARNLNPGVAGKTGSAEWTADTALPHSWFIGYFPAESPRVALAVVIERGGLGQETAARIARRIVGSPALRRYVLEESRRQ